MTTTTRFFPAPLILALVLAAAPLAAEPALLNGTASVTESVSWKQFVATHPGAGGERAATAADWLNGLRKLAPDKYHVPAPRLYDVLAARMRLLAPEWLMNHEAAVVELHRSQVYPAKGINGQSLPPRYPVQLVDCRVGSSGPVPLMLWDLDQRVPTLHAYALLVLGAPALPPVARFRMSQAPGSATHMSLEGSPQPNNVIGLVLSLKAGKDGKIDLTLTNMSSGIFAVYLVADHAVGFEEKAGSPDFGRTRRTLKTADLQTHASKVFPGKVVFLRPGITLDSQIRKHYRPATDADRARVLEAVVNANRGFSSLDSDSQRREDGVVVLAPCSYLGLPGLNPDTNLLRTEPGYDGVETR